MNDKQILEDQWTGFCRRLEAAGRRVLGSEHVQTPREQVESLRFLLREFRSALTWDTEVADPLFPHMFKLDDTGSGPSAAPNLDNAYFAAAVRSGNVYRITANLRGINGATFSLHGDDWSIYGDCGLDAFDVGSDGEFTLTLADAPVAGNWLSLHPQATFVAMRFYHDDWAQYEPLPIRIERIGSLGEVPAAPEPVEFMRRLDRAAQWVEQRPWLWPIRKLQQYENTPINQLRPPFINPGTSDAIQFGGGFFEIGDDEALLIESDVPQARYWSFQLYSLPWWEPVDPTNRVSSLNHHHVRVDGDDKVRIVISHRDPGVQNWLDAAGMRRGAVQYRWLWSENSPAPVARLLKLDQLRAALPADTPAFSREQRNAQIELRRRYFARRFHY
jgi:hypothetical protein